MLLARRERVNASSTAPARAGSSAQDHPSARISRRIDSGLADHVVTLNAEIGEDRVVWASDYPHLDATYPGVVRELEEQLVALPSSARDKVRGENAARLYRLS